MRDKRLLTLRRKLETAKLAGFKARADLLRAHIGALEAILEDAAEPEPPKVYGPPAGMGASEWEEIDGQEDGPWPGVLLTPAAQARSDELGLTPEDFADHQPSGKGGEFLVSDVQRIAEAKAHIEEDTDGDD